MYRGIYKWNWTKQHLMNWSSYSNNQTLAKRNLHEVQIQKVIEVNPPFKDLIHMEEEIARSVWLQLQHQLQKVEPTVVQLQVLLQHQANSISSNLFNNNDILHQSLLSI